MKQTLRTKETIYGGRLCGYAVYMHSLENDISQTDHDDDFDHDHEVIKKQF